MKNKIILVTGATDGIGKQHALKLAQLGHSVLLHGRNLQKGQRVQQELVQATNNPNIDLFIADLASLREVQGLAANISKQYSKLDILVNNAGVAESKRNLTVDGYETTFAVNHLAMFLLTLLLLPLLDNRTQSRIVNVSSQLHSSPSSLSNFNGENGYNRSDAYALSKLCNVLFSYELADKLKSTLISVNALHPGVINTKLLRESFGGGASYPDSSETLDYVFTAPELEGVTGKYFSNSQQVRSSDLSYDWNARKRLWELSKEAVQGFGLANLGKYSNL